MTCLALACASCPQQGSGFHERVQAFAEAKGRKSTIESTASIVRPVRVTKSEKMVEGRKMQKLTCASRGLPPRIQTGSDSA